MIQMMVGEDAPVVASIVSDCGSRHDDIRGGRWLPPGTPVKLPRGMSSEPAWEPRPRGWARANLVLHRAE